MVTVSKFIVSLMLLFSSAAFADSAKMTSYQLNEKIMAFSDNYQEGIDETVDDIINAGVTPSARLFYQAVKVFYTQSSVSIASESDAVHQLLDFLVMLRLQRLMWDNGGEPNLSSKAEASKLAKQLLKLELQLHRLASQVLAKQDIDRVMKLTKRWKQDNPDREYVAFVRFQDFAHSEDKAAIEKVILGGGLFSSISDAEKQLEETNHAIDRGIFVMNRLPILLEWQSELFLYRVLSTQEMQDLLQQDAQIATALERISTRLDQWPQDVEKVVSSSDKTLRQLSQDLAKTSEKLRVISDQFSPLFLGQDNNEDGDIVLQQIQLIFKDALATSQQLAEVSKHLNTLSYSPDKADHFSQLLAQQVTQADEILARRVEDLDNKLLIQQEIMYQRILTLLIIALVAFPLIFFLFYVLARRHLIAYQSKHSQS
jgi:hypothetical protein